MSASYAAASTSFSFGIPVVADFNSDSNLDILLPICDTIDCTKVSSFAVYSFTGSTWAWSTINFELNVTKLNRF